jgi:HTH-type transcriptional regulator / antitoxin HigA
MAKGLKNDAWTDERYYDLVREFPLQPLRSDKELARATAVIDGLIDKGLDKLSVGEDAYLAILSDIVEKYETEHHSIEDVTEAQMLEHLIEAKGVTQRAVAEGTHIQESAISDLLAGRRRFTRNHIEQLSRYFHVSPAVFFPNAPSSDKE